MRQEGQQTELDRQLLAWSRQLDEHQANLDRWKIRVATLEGSKRVHMLKHIHLVESKIAIIRERLGNNQALQKPDDFTRGAGHQSSEPHESNPKETLKQGIVQAWGDLSEAISRAAKQFTKR